MDRAWLAGSAGAPPDLPSPDHFPRRLRRRRPLCGEGKPEDRLRPPGHPFSPTWSSVICVSCRSARRSWNRSTSITSARITACGIRAARRDRGAEERRDPHGANRSRPGQSFAEAENPAAGRTAPAVPVFPGARVISDINLAVRSTTEAQDFVLEHFDSRAGSETSWRASRDGPANPDGRAWRNIAAKTSYTNKNLVISGLVLDDQNQFRLIAFDASHIAARSLEVVIDASLAGGTVAGSIALSETAQSLNMKLRLVAENVSLDTLRGYIGRPPEFLAGDVAASHHRSRRSDRRAAHLDRVAPGADQQSAAGRISSSITSS